MNDTDRAEELRQALDKQCEYSRTLSKTYQWIVTTIVAALFFALGLIVQSERYSSQITTNTVEIRQLKSSLDQINTKLDRMLEVR